MVGIILASHGDFANGILQSGEMIFGKQDEIQAVTLLPHEGPDDLRAKFETAISSFEKSDEILFLVDLWGGTPFNQASALIEDHQDQWAIVTGMNLPMLLETLGCRFSSESAQEIASQILASARDGVKVLPEKLEPKAPAENITRTETDGTIPKGTVLGDGKIKIVLARIDSRLLHGQVATSWTKTTKPTRIIVVSDAVAHDDLRKKMIEQAAPPGVKANVIPIQKMIEISKDPRFGTTKALLLFETPEDALRCVEGGVDIKEINLGSIAHSKGKVALTKAVSMGKNDVEAFDKLLADHVKIDVRKVPADSPEDFDHILKKAKNELY